MNNQNKSCKIKCKYNIRGICHAYGECIAKDLFISELEKIKAEMIKNFWNGDLDETQEAFNQGISKSILILDNHISKLKGENSEILQFSR